VEVQGEIAEMKNERLYNLYSSPYMSITEVIKLRRVRWAEHVAPIRKIKN
jgi:hypothetical protein